MKRVKAFVLVQALMAASLVFSSYKAVETTATADVKLYWDELNSLSWEHFKPVVERSNNDAAMSSIAIESRSVIDKTGAFIRVRAVFDPQKSWVKNDCKTAYILNHEQMHYNIVEIFARKLRKAIATSTFKQATFKDDYNRLFDRLADEHEAYQERYDEETNHSIYKEDQEAWNTKIQAELDLLDEYAAPLVKLRIRK